MVTTSKDVRSVLPVSGAISLLAPYLPGEPPLGSTLEYRYGDSNPGFRTENPAS
jgi:hypothetical protein